MKHDYIIAIDPDVDKSGMAVLGVSPYVLSVNCLEFPKLLDSLISYKKAADGLNITAIVIVEAGWLNQSNWHLKNGDNMRLASAKGNSTGRNHEVGRKIIEMCKHYGLEVIEQRPLRKCWKGKDGKITQQEIAQFIPDFPKRSNQEERDAALLAWNHSGLPIRIQVQTFKKQATK